MNSFKQFLEQDLLTEEQLQESMPEIVKIIKDGVKETVKEVAKKLKAWALENMKEYELNGKGDLIRKIINNPEIVTKQLMKNVLAPEISVKSEVDKYSSALDAAFELPELK